MNRGWSFHYRIRQPGLYRCKTAPDLTNVLQVDPGPCILYPNHFIIEKNDLGLALCSAFMYEIAPTKSWFLGDFTSGFCIL